MGGFRLTADGAITTYVHASDMNKSHHATDSLGNAVVNALNQQLKRHVKNAKIPMSD